MNVVNECGVTGRDSECSTRETANVVNECGVTGRDSEGKTRECCDGERY